MSLPRKLPEASEPLPTASKSSWEHSKANANAQMSVLGIWEKADNLPNPLHKRGPLSFNDALIPMNTKTIEPQIFVTAVIKILTVHDLFTHARSP